MPPVLFEDEHLLIVDKPAGVAAHGGSGVAHGVIERARAARPELPLLELAHRLDRETSGAMMLAKSRKALLGLHSMQREGRIGKRYLALVIGDWVNDRQHARFALARRPEAVGGERRVVVDEEQGQEAHTIFHLRERFGAFSLVEAELRTGRTHQIRVHLAHLGFRILGDDRYGDFEANREAARGRWPQAGPARGAPGEPGSGPRLGRMFLHAWKLELAHPVTGQALQIGAPLAPECEAVLAYLRTARPV
jgi:23S rRNA pseudouridine955/2504/2580 synthase